MGLKDFFKGKKVYITGHTGFKGSWLCLWLHMLGAEVYGYSIEPPTDPSLYVLARVGCLINTLHGDVRNGFWLKRTMLAAEPDIVIHLAAQALVRNGYDDPAETYNTNVMGTVNMFEAVRQCKSVRSVVVVTSDKCYENREWGWGYRENDYLGGADPYSTSKACAEYVTLGYVRAFFDARKIGIATARAGNVIGGGDWAADRLVPDCMRSFLKDEIPAIRNPDAVRPWQHVLEPLSGYLLLARKLYECGGRYAGPWNFGPGEQDMRSVGWVVAKLCAGWGGDAGYGVDAPEARPRETQILKLDSSKARQELGWRPRWSLDAALDKTVEWYKAYKQGADVREVSLRQIGEYEEAGDRS